MIHKPSSSARVIPCLMMILLMQLLSGSAMAASNPPSLFGTQEIAKTDITAFERWTGMLERVRSGTALQAAIPSWPTLIDSLKEKSPFELIKIVNSFVNEIKYQTDPIIWHNEDYWATPEEFYRMTGDCEDYAITKYMILKDLGVKPSDMRIAIVKDMNINQYHAILVLYVSGGHILILDNQISDVILSTRVRHYKVIYTINETGWWRHL
jgi:predicted transglutaminase-like cysteine proteinase